MKKVIKKIIQVLGGTQQNVSCEPKMNEVKRDMGETYLLNMEYRDFEKWVDTALAVELPENIEAFCFNLYEDFNPYDDGKKLYSVEIIGSPSFDETDEDWACDEVFNNRAYPLCWKSDKSWEGVLEEMRGLVWRYLREGKYASLLRSKQAVAIGFVDGDLELL